MGNTKINLDNIGIPRIEKATEQLKLFKWIDKT